MGLLGRHSELEVDWSEQMVGWRASCTPVCGGRLLVQAALLMYQNTVWEMLIAVMGRSWDCCCYIHQYVDKS